MGRHRTVENAELLEAARAVFQKRGLNATTREVAQAAGISQAVLYQRFRSKEELFFAAMLPPPPDIDKVLGEEPKTIQNMEDYLNEMATRLLEYFRSSAPAILRMTTHHAFDPQDYAKSNGSLPDQGLIDGLVTRIKSLQARGFIDITLEPRAAARGLATGLFGMAVLDALANKKPGPPNDELVSRFVRMLWVGLVPKTKAVQGKFF
jgi:AcrR family transcriptional regulator